MEFENENPSYSWNAPMCLIDTDENGKISVNSDTKSALQKVLVPVVVVGIVGLYRTGKSYLMNRLAGQQNGFALGSTVQSKTKGIWIWCVPHPKRPNCCLLLLDTEGLGDVEKGDENHDIKIFALAVLLTSTLVYNSLGVIDQPALEKLYFVTELTEHVKIKSTSKDDDESSKFDQFFPSFVWAVRDFTLELEIDGNPVTEDEYLENALKLKYGAGKKVSDYNLPRECIRTYFPQRKCVVFPKPVNDTNQLKSLESIEDHHLDDVFLQQTQKFLEFIFDNSRMKTICGRNVNGRMLAGLTNSYVDAIRAGAIPCIETAVEATAKLENESAIQETVHFYGEMLLKSVQFPTETMLDLSSAHHYCEQQASEYFLKLAVFDTEKVYYERMTEEIEKAYRDFCSKNEAASKQCCNELLQLLLQPIEGTFKSGAYARPGGYSQYKADMEELLAKYKQTSRKGVMSDEVLYEFLKQQEGASAMVLKADEKLSDEAKKLEEERQRCEIAEREKLAAEEAQKQCEQMLADKQKSYDEHLIRLENQTKEEQKKIREDYENLLSKKLKEQERLLKEGFQERSKNMEREIDQLRNNIQKQQKESSGSIFSFFGDLVSSFIPAFKHFRK